MLDHDRITGPRCHAVAQAGRLSCGRRQRWRFGFNTGASGRGGICRQRNNRIALGIDQPEVVQQDIGAE